MYKISNNPSKQDVLEFLSKSTSFGNLGLFIGAGFSKAVINDGAVKSALSWGELLEKCAEDMGIDYKEIWKEGVGFPQIATTLCEQHTKNNGCDYETSLNILKKKICDLTSLYPTRERRKEFSEYLETFEPSWIITTNYDLVIECLLPGRSVTLSPKDQLIAESGTIPVFHLHGVRTNSEKLVITQEDYVSLFRPNEYRQIKLALTIKESTVLLLGYGLGDVNVLTALDWSKNVFKGQQSNYPHEVVQILRVEMPSANPYRTKNGIIILETDDLITFFKEFSEVRKDLTEKERKEIDELNKLAKMLDEAEPDNIAKFIDKDVFRKEVVQKLCDSPNHLISTFEIFLDKCIEETWNRSLPKNAFSGYAENLTILLDILDSFTFEDMPPALFEVLATALENVSFFVGSSAGKSYAADEIWQARKTKLPAKIVEELKNFAERREVERLATLLNF